MININLDNKGYQTVKLINSNKAASIAETALDDKKAQDIRVFAIPEGAALADNMIVATGTSDRHVSSLAQNVITTLKQNGIQVFGVEGLESGDWVLIDAGDIVVHIFQEETRRMYNIERLWAPEYQSHFGENDEEGNIRII